MVELAIVLPILLLLLLGIVELGRAVMIYQVTTNATREAVRLAIVPGATDSAVLNACNTSLDRGGISSNGRVVQILNGSGGPSNMSSIRSKETVVVRASIPFSENNWGLSIILGNRTFSTSAVMRRE
jgi:hypothetical protein